MDRLEAFSELGWKHPLWELLRFYRSMGRGEAKKQEWLCLLKTQDLCAFPGYAASAIPIEKGISQLLDSYIKESAAQFEDTSGHLRTEKEAVSHCDRLGVSITKTTTRSADHYQSPKALVGAVTFIATEFCKQKGIQVDPNPQNRCVWISNDSMHVTTRRLDGAIPGLVNPVLLWEIKEYWGKTSGGSKMSDAVYECQLVGRELRDSEERIGFTATHVVFLDGLDQWGTRRSDFVRFMDLANQGLIDHLIVGSEVEVQWERLLAAKL